MQNPVAIPSGGMTIFFVDMGVRPSRTRQAITASKATRDPATVEPVGRTIMGGYLQDTREQGRMGGALRLSPRFRT